jgi:Uma2 family endonuclease
MAGRDGDVDPHQLRAIAELLARRQEKAGKKGSAGSGRGGEAGDEAVPPSTPSGEATVPVSDAPPRPYGYVTPRRYLVRERAVEHRNEYNDGEIVAMSGVSRRHSLITGRLFVSLAGHLRGRGCEVHAGEMKVKADEGRRYMYPDLAVVCGRPAFEGKREDVLTNPVLVVEVLSPSTERNDRGWKMAAYQRLPSLREIVLLAQDEPAAEVSRRGPDGRWEVYLPLRALDSTLRFESIGCAVTLAELYGDLPPAPGPTAGAGEPAPSGAWPA